LNSFPNLSTGNVCIQELHPGYMTSATLRIAGCGFHTRELRIITRNAWQYNAVPKGLDRHA
jgi:hypothetical protein